MKFKIVSISLPPKDYTALTLRLAKVGMTRSEYVRSLLREDSIKGSLELTRRALKSSSKKGGKR